ncbi:ATPase, partial [Clavibacter michiganensis subsp. insidiosus]
AAPVETAAPEADAAASAARDADDADASGAEPDEEVIVGTHAFDELFDDAEDDDVDPEDRVPAAPAAADDDDADDALPAAAPTPFDAVVSPEAGSAW